MAEHKSIVTFNEAHETIKAEAMLAKVNNKCEIMYFNFILFSLSRYHYPEGV